MCQTQKVVVVAYRRRPFIGKILVFWIGGLLWEVVAHGGSTVIKKNITSYTLNGTFCSFEVNVSVVNVKLNSS